jgi:hypothetical protein
MRHAVGLYNTSVGRHLRRMLSIAAVCCASAVLSAQAPRQPAPVKPGQPPPAAAQKPPNDGRPSEVEVWFPVYPTAVFLRAYDAGRGQRYYIYGVTTPFAEMVTYYRNVLKERGDLVFEVPATHTFEMGRFREETMAFPPGVTVKDYTFGGSAGYPNPRPGTQPDRFPTLIQIVPPPAGTPRQ